MQVLTKVQEIVNSLTIKALKTVRWVVLKELLMKDRILIVRVHILQRTFKDVMTALISKIDPDMTVKEAIIKVTIKAATTDLNKAATIVRNKAAIKTETMTVREAQDPMTEMTAGITDLNKVVTTDLRKAATIVRSKVVLIVLRKAASIVPKVDLTDLSKAVTTDRKAVTTDRNKAVTIVPKVDFVHKADVLKDRQNNFWSTENNLLKLKNYTKRCFLFQTRMHTRLSVNKSGLKQEKYSLVSI